jgi:hypothetical protein
VVEDLLLKTMQLIEHDLCNQAFIFKSTYRGVQLYSVVSSSRWSSPPVDQGHRLVSTPVGHLHLLIRAID